GRGLQVSQDIEDSHVTLTPVQPDGQQESSSVPSFFTSMLNPISDAGVESIFMTASSPIAPLQTSTPIMTPSTIATITTSSDAPIPPTTIPSAVLQNLPTFDSVFRFEERVKTPEGSEDEGNDEEDQDLRLSEEARIQEEEEADELYRDVNVNQGRGLQVTQNIEDSHVTLTPVHPDGLQESSSVSSFVTSMLNPISDAGVEYIFTTASSLIVSLQPPTPIMTPSTIATITTSSNAPIPPTTIPSTILENLPTFNSVFRFDERLRSLETTFSEYRETNPFVDAVSAIPSIVHQYMTQQMTKAVKEQVSRILPRIEESVNATLEVEVLTRSSHSSKTSYAIAADLSEMELKKILIEKIEGNKSIQRSDEQRNLYKALVEAYDADKTILDTYGESTILKRRQEDDDQEGPSAGSERGSTTGSQSRQLSASESAFAEEPVQTTCQMEEPSHPVFETGADDQPIVQTSQHPEWFSQPRRPPSPDHDWNKTPPATQGDAQSWISELARQTDAHSSFNELLD
nr:hypothetical protein [Tanacetum cinerariifolium]